MITTQTTETIHTSTGTGSLFAFDFFAFPGTAHVSVDGTELAANLFRASGFLSNTGGQVELLIPDFESGREVRIWRRTPLVQDYDFQYNEQMPSRVIGGALDRCVCILQEHGSWFAAMQGAVDWLKNSLAELAQSVGSGFNSIWEKFNSVDSAIAGKADANDPRFHTHDNMGALDGLGVSNGAPTWDGKPWPASGMNPFAEVDLTPQCDGVTQTFETGATLAPSVPMTLYYGGQRLVPEVNYTIDFGDGTITTLFDTPPDGGDSRHLIFVYGDAVAFPPNAPAFPVTGHDASITNPSAGILVVEGKMSAEGAVDAGVVSQVATVNDIYAVLRGIYPVGCLYVSMSAANPAQLFNFGSWQRVAIGRALVGIDETDADFGAPGAITGAKAVALAQAQLPAVKANIPQQALAMNPIQIPDHQHFIMNADKGSSKDRDPSGAKIHVAKANDDSGFGAAYSTFTATPPSVGVSSGVTNAGNTPPVTPAGNVPAHSTDLLGSGQAHNNVQPSFAIYVWTRTA